MKKNIVFILIVCSALIVGGCSHKKAPLLDPQPLAVINKSVNVKTAVRSALHRYNWIIESDKPGYMIARYNRRKHLARIKVVYSRKFVDINYIGSENLNYHIDEEGMQRIHRTYNKWIAALEKTISSETS